MYIAVRQWQTKPRGQKFGVNRNLLSLRSFATSLKKTSLKSDFIHIFHDFIHVYNPGAGQTIPFGDKILMLTGTSCHFVRSLVASLKNLVEV